MHGCLALGRIWYHFLQFLQQLDLYKLKSNAMTHTSLSNTQLFSLRSSGRQFQSWWFWLSKHFQ